MKLILLTMPDFFVEEDKIITALFDEGLELLHLRKPAAEPILSERLLSLIPPQYHSRIVTHDNFYLKDEYSLRGIHLNARNPHPPVSYKGHVSKSLHTIDELKKEKRNYTYVFLSPIFNSISKPNYPAGFTLAMLKDAARHGLIDHRVMALGGMNEQHIRAVKELGFGGAVIMGDLWSRFDIRATRDYKPLINHFKTLRQAVE